VTDIPDHLSLRHNRDREGAWDLNVRRVSASIILAIVVLGALDAFGQRPETTVAAASAGSLEIYAPTRVRGGLLYMARFTIRAREDIAKATLVLDPGWAEAITINTIEPSPVGEGSDNGRLVLELGHVPAGQKYVLYMHLQVNPTNVGHRSQDVELRDGDEVLATVDRTITVFP
jgi:hypothetical protein